MHETATSDGCQVERSGGAAAGRGRLCEACLHNESQRVNTVVQLHSRTAHAIAADRHMQGTFLRIALFGN